MGPPHLFARSPHDIPLWRNTSIFFKGAGELGYGGPPYQNSHLLYRFVLRTTLLTFQHGPISPWFLRVEFAEFAQVPVDFPELAY